MQSIVPTQFLGIDLERYANASYDALDKVYHSNSMYEMLVNADLMDVDLCNPFVLWYLAKQTTYHHAYWPHTAKRFVAFKNLLRHDKRIRTAISSDKDLVFWTLVADMYKRKKDDIASYPSMHNTPGAKQHFKNIEELMHIVEKCIAKDAASKSKDKR